MTTRLEKINTLWQTLFDNHRFPHDCSPEALALEEQARKLEQALSTDIKPIINNWSDGTITCSDLLEQMSRIANSPAGKVWTQDPKWCEECEYPEAEVESVLHEEELQPEGSFTVIKAGDQLVQQWEDGEHTVTVLGFNRVTTGNQLYRTMYFQVEDNTYGSVDLLTVGEDFILKVKRDGVEIPPNAK